MPQNNTGDNWSQLLSDFGIEAPAEEKQPAQTVTQPATREVVTETARAGNEIVQSKSVTETRVTESVESKPEKPKEKKSIFSRFPKINIFGSSPKELDTVADGSRQSGKSFTGNTLEKTPVTPKHQPKEPPKKPQSEPAAEISKQTAKPAKRPQKNETNSWSVLASQIDTLAGNESSSSEPKFSEPRPSSGRRQRPEPVSIFDDAEPSRSEELAALENLLDVPVKSKKPRIDESVERSAEQPGGRGRGNNRRFDAGLADESGEETPVRQQRRRNSRYQNNDEKRYERPYREPLDEPDDIIIEEEFKEVGADDNFDEIEEQPIRSQRGRGSRNQDLRNQDNSRSGWRGNNNGGGGNVRDNRQQRNNDRVDNRNENRGDNRGRAVVRHDIDNAPRVEPFDSFESFGGDVLKGDAFEKTPTVQGSRERRGRGNRGADNRSDNYSDRRPEERFEEVSENRYSERSPKQPPRRNAEPEYDNDDAETIVEDDLDAKAVEQIRLHQNLPSWEDAIGDILAGNIARHRNQPSNNRNGRR